MANGFTEKSSNVSNGICYCMCAIVHESLDEIAAYRNTDGLPPDGYELWSCKLLDLVEINQPEVKYHKGHVQKSQCYYCKDIFIYLYIQYSHILKA